MATRRDVERFLEEFRLAAGEHLQYVRPQDANQWAIDLGLSGPSEFRPFIMGLTADNYVSGPEDDHHSDKHRVCVFGCEVEGVEVYIKLRLSRDPKGWKNYASVWSFHRAERPLTYPLRGASE